MFPFFTPWIFLLSGVFRGDKMRTLAKMRQTYRVFPQDGENPLYPWTLPPWITLFLYLHYYLYENEMSLTAMWNYFTYVEHFFSFHIFLALEIQVVKNIARNNPEEISVR